MPSSKPPNAAPSASQPANPVPSLRSRFLQGTSRRALIAGAAAAVVVVAAATGLVGEAQIKGGGLEIHIWPRGAQAAVASDDPVVMPMPTTETELRLRENEVRMLLEHPKHVEEPARVLSQVFPDLLHPKNGYRTISVDDAAQAVTDPRTGPALRQMLSYLEGVSSAYINGTVDRASFKKNWRMYIIHSYLAYQHVLPEMKQRCGCFFVPFEDLGSAWAKGQFATPAVAKWDPPAK